MDNSHNNDNDNNDNHHDHDNNNKKNDNDYIYIYVCTIYIPNNVTYLKSPQGEVTSSAPSCNPPSAVASSFPRVS